jgi:hypothetical protein
VKSTAVIAESEQVELSVTFTLNVPEVLAACATQAVIAAPQMSAARMSLFMSPTFLPFLVAGCTTN